MTDPKQLAKLAYALVDYYVLQYKSKFNRAPEINRFKAKYGFQDMISDFGLESSKKIIDLYISGNRASYNVNELLYNYDKLHRIVVEREEDDAKREELRAETKKRVEEWERTHGKR